MEGEKTKMKSPVLKDIVLPIRLKMTLVLGAVSYDSEYSLLLT